MLSFCGSLIIYEAVEPCDMRKGCNGLQGGSSGKAQGQRAGWTPFVFPNKRRTRLKVLYFHKSGLWVMTKLKV